MVTTEKSGRRGGKKDLDFDLNLIPAIDLLSVCICFLLLTAVWIHLGALKVSQGVGETNKSNGVNQPSLWIQVERSGDLVLSTRDLPQGVKGLERSVLSGESGRVNSEKLKQAIEIVKKRVPTLVTVVVRPQVKVQYGNVITVIDELKAAKIPDVGIAPET